MISYSTAQEFQNAIGFRRHYGSSPALNLSNFLKSHDIAEYILVQPHDICNIFKSLDTSTNKIKSQKFTVMSDNLPSMIRNTVFLDVIIDKTLTLREKVETFLDLYMNQYLTAKTLSILASKLKIIQNEICDSRTACGGLFSFKKLKYKQIDELSDIINLWIRLSKSNDIKRDEAEIKYRDSRLRFMYKERYEFRQNLIDGDYIWGIKYNKLPLNALLDTENLDVNYTDANEDKTFFEPLVKFNEYLLFREKGISFPIHKSEENHQFFNVTLLDYIEGKKKDNKDHCEVLGFWGDMVISPFWSFGVKVNTKENLDKFYKKINMDYFYSVNDLIEYNVEEMITNVNLYFDEKASTSIEYCTEEKIEDLKLKKDFEGVIFFSYEGFENNKDYIQGNQGVCKNLTKAVFIIESPAFYTPIEIKKRTLLLEKQSESIAKNLEVVLDLFSAKYCKLKDN